MNRKFKKNLAKLNIVHSKDSTFYKYQNINEIAKCSLYIVKRSLYSKQNDLTEFKGTLETFYYNLKK